MPCSVAVIEAVLPQELSREGIEAVSIASSSRHRDLHGVDCDVALEDPSVRSDLLLRGRSKVQRSGDVRRTIRILGSRIAQVNCGRRCKQKIVISPRTDESEKPWVGEDSLRFGSIVAQSSGSGE